MLVTALVTPFHEGGRRLDLDRLQQLVLFQLDEGAHQVLLMGTTGEGPALSDAERLTLLDAALEVCRPRQLMVSLGVGRSEELIARGQAALSRGVTDLLLVDCPYSGPSSIALREDWYGPVAEALPEARLMPYAVPSRTGCELLPDDLARLAEDHPNVYGVKDATGRLARMERVRELCGEDFCLLCGEDAQLRDAMLDPDIRAQGGCSTISNLAPGAMRALVDACREGRAVTARELTEALSGLCGLTCVTSEETVFVDGRELRVPNRARNPAPLKAALQELGVLDGGCRPPLGALAPRGLEQVKNILRLTVLNDRTILAPLERRFGIDVLQRLLAAGELVRGVR